MAVQGDKAYQIELLQENLQTIRKIAGWTIEELGDKIGVTKQTISNLENMKTKMSLTQYIAIRTILDYESHEHPENDILPKAINLLLDEGRNLSKEEYSKIKSSIDTVAAAASGGAESSVLSSLFSTVVGTAVIGVGLSLFPPISVLGGAAASLWIRKLYNNKDTDK